MEIQNAQKKAQRRAAKATAEIQQLIDRADDQVEQLQDQLKSAQNQIPADPQLVDSMNRQLNAARQELQKLKGHLAQFNTMEQILKSVK